MANLSTERIKALRQLGVTGDKNIIGGDELAALTGEILRLRDVEKLLKSSRCKFEQCYKQATCFVILNEGTYTELLVGCDAHMPAIVRNSSVFCKHLRSEDIVDATRLPTLEQEGKNV